MAAIQNHMSSWEII